MESDSQAEPVFARVDLIRGGSVRAWGFALIYSVGAGLFAGCLAALALMILHFSPAADVSSLLTIGAPLALLSLGSIFVCWISFIVQRAREIRKGYSTAVNAPMGVPIVDPRSAAVIQTVGEPPLSRTEFRMRVRAARAQRETMGKS